MTNKSTTTGIIASTILTTALALTPTISSAASTERCADIVKGGSNSCAVKSLGISCQGNAKEDNMTGAWIKVPTGTCGNIISFCASPDTAPDSVDQDRLAKACGKIADQTDGSVTGGRIVDKFGESV